MPSTTEYSTEALPKISDPTLIKCLRKLEHGKQVGSAEYKKSLSQLEEMGLASKGSITEHGVIVLWKIDELEKCLKEAIGMRQPNRIEVDDYRDGNSWANALIQFIGASKKTLKMTTIGYSSLEDPVWGKQFEDILAKASHRGVAIYVLAARGFMSKNIVEFFSEIGHIELVERVLLEKPPLTLPPIVKDFSHVAVSDGENWLYLEPHKAPHKVEPRVHVGKVYVKSPLIAEMLGEIFDTVWNLSKR
jgi:hypothetical protein